MPQSAAALVGLDKRGFLQDGLTAPAAASSCRVVRLPFGALWHPALLKLFARPTAGRTLVTAPLGDRLDRRKSSGLLLLRSPPPRQNPLLSLLLHSRHPVVTVTVIIIPICGIMPRGWQRLYKKREKKMAKGWWKWSLSPVATCLCWM